MKERQYNDKNTQKFGKAISKRNIDLVKIGKLIDKGADINASTKLSAHSIPALFAAIDRDDIDLVRLLLEKGANTNKTGPLDLSVFEWTYAAQRSINGPKYQNTKAIFTELFKYSNIKHLGSKLVDTLITHKDQDLFEFLFNAGKIDLTQKNYMGLNTLDTLNRAIEKKELAHKNTDKLVLMREYLLAKGAVAEEDLGNMIFISSSSGNFSLEKFMEMMTNNYDKAREDKPEKQDDSSEEQKSSFDPEIMKAVLFGLSHYNSGPRHQDEVKFGGGFDDSDSDS